MKSYKTDARNRVLFSKDMKIAELIDANYELLSILLRMDVQLPFGDKSIEELCEKYNMSSQMFLTICQIYTNSEFEPSVDALPHSDVEHIIRYLRSSHRYYLESMLPSIERGVNEVLASCDAKQSAVVRKFYNDYADEVKAHLDYEERVIFPYVEGVLRGENAERSMAENMECHTDICDKVDDIKSIAIKYLPESCSTAARCGLIYDLFHLREDLIKHTLIEVRVLTPLVMKIEKQGRL